MGVRVGSCGSRPSVAAELIATQGDRSIGVQVSKHLPHLDITGDLTTEGAEALSLVKGVQMRLKAVALSIKPGGQVGSLSVGGRIHTSGRDVVSVEIEGDLDQLSVTGGISATGDGSDAVHARDGGPDFTDITVTSEHVQKWVRTT